MYMIQDWASNTLQYNGKFNFSAYGAYLGVPMTFETFEDAAEYISEKLDDNFDDLYIEEIAEH